MNRPSSTVEWLDELRVRGVISMKVRQDIAHMLRDGNGSVRTQAIVFLYRMMKEHPDLWVSFKAKMRLLGRL